MFSLFRGLWRNPNFPLLWAGQTVSLSRLLWGLHLMLPRTVVDNCEPCQPV